jgi:hypothetical protein
MFGFPGFALKVLDVRGEKPIRGTTLLEVPTWGSRFRGYGVSALDRFSELSFRRRDEPVSDL